MDEIRSAFRWLVGDDANVLCAVAGDVTWWTFAGGRANAALAHELGQRLDGRVTSNNLAVRFSAHLSIGTVERGLRELLGTDPAHLRPPDNEQALDGLKFSECLPSDLASDVVRTRISDPEGVRTALGQPTRFVTV